MKLLDLNPRWLVGGAEASYPNMFMFDCPCGCKGTQRETLLTCKNVVMKDSEQITALESVLGDDWNRAALCRSNFAWTFSSVDFATISVTPSIDASSSGHWHGFIKNGQIQ